MPELIGAIRTAADADIVVFSGGSSVGERDLILDAEGAVAYGLADTVLASRKLAAAG